MAARFTWFAKYKWEISPKRNLFDFALSKKKLKKTDGINYEFDDYRIQFIVSEKNHQKVLSINGFCETPVDWHKEHVFVNDGGDCYFYAEINLRKKKSHIFSI